jgi:manganese transport protein
MEREATPRSLPEVHSSVQTGQPSIWKRMFAFAGPAYLVSVGYMDPGNWASDLEGGARFGYQLLWVIVISNFMAILLQTLSARLGIVSRRDLAQACRDEYPRIVSLTLWILCEIAIAACDLAEVLGTAIGLNLLFHLPLIAGVILTSADTLLILWFTRFGIRVIEGFVLGLIAVIAGCFLIELWFARPPLAGLAAGLIPHLNDQNLFVAIAILGATVMPHNLYLHSALVQTRRIGDNVREKRAACKFNLIDSVVALNGALIVNASILILASTVFFTRHIIVTEIQQAHLLLVPLLGTSLAGIIFAIALLCSGQSSTLTGTLAGQIVMEGFIQIRVRPWLRRFVTRLFAVIPAVVTILILGEKSTFKLLLLSQVILSLQLPFAVIPLVQFTGDRTRMGDFVNRPWLKIVAWATVILIIGLNVRLVGMAVSDWIASAPQYQWLILTFLIPILSVLGLLLLWMSAQPMLIRYLRRSRLANVLPATAETAIPILSYRDILVPLDHSNRDPVALSHAAALAKMHGATIHLLHVEEGVTSNVYGDVADTEEVESGRQYFESILARLRSEGVTAELHVDYGVRPRAAIVKWARTNRPDLIVMGAHGHKLFSDLVLGTTINAVRHEVEVPILIVRTHRRV